MKGPEEVCKVIPNDPEGRYAKVKREFALSVSSMCNHLTYEQAKLACIARKRKERQESISSISQERKVIRSNSEERPLEVKNDETTKDMRRVSSQEDFKKPERNGTFYNTFRGDIISDQSPYKDVSNNLIGYDDCENERRRTHERFSRPLVSRGRRITASKKPNGKQFSKPKNKSSVQKHVSPIKLDKSESNVKNKNDKDTTDNKIDLDSLLQLHPAEKQRTPSPEPQHTAPSIDLSTLHEQIDCTEPILSISSQEITEDTETLPGSLVASNRLLLSPRNSIIMTHRIYLDPEIPNFNTMKGSTKNPVEQRMKDLSKQMNSMKKKIKKHEEEFETHFGYKPSHADRLNDNSMRKLYSELNQKRKELKQLKDDSVLESCDSADQGMNRKCTGVKLQDTLFEIEKRLSSRLTMIDGPLTYDQMNTEQLTEEKIAMQKALLYLESLHGRPSGKEDRDLVRPLYDRYRTLKRLIAKNALPNNSIELATIHEDETMNFVSTPPAQVVETDSEKTLHTAASTDSDTDTSIGENLHSLSRMELVEQQRATVEEKKELRRSLKIFELEFHSKTGRRVQKDDKLPMENVYASYKKAKAKLRLLEALLNKKVL